MELTGNIIIDLNTFEKLSREVGYYNCKANRKDTDDNYDNDSIEEYGRLRESQLDMLEKLIEKYGNDSI